MRKAKSFITLIACLLTLASSTAQSDSRVEVNLNSNPWKFKRENIKNAHKKSFKDQDWMSITIPHDYNGGSDGVHNDVFSGRFGFEMDPDHRNMYKGAAWYRTPFTVEKQYEGKRIFINFEAVSLVADVWVNGKKVGQHKGGYTAFSFDITDYIVYGKPNTLAVKSDNTNSDALAPWMSDEKNAFPFSFDYAIYGGIYRDVTLSITDDLKIEQVFNTPVIGGQAAAVLSIKTMVKNYAKDEQSFILTSTVLDPEGKEVAKMRRKKTIAGGETVAIQQSNTSMGDIYYWSAEQPDFYTVHSTITKDDKTSDDFTSNFGFRYYSLANNQPFILNGKESFIRGVNRHQDMEGLGYALPNSQHLADIKLIKDAGFNFVRHAHYPCDPVFAKAAMEEGLMLWLEIPLTGSTSANPLFLESSKQQLKEMIEQNYNNPAVIIWGIGNESDRSGGSEDVSNSVYTELVKEANKLDPTRVVTGCNYKYKSNQDIVNIYAPQDWRGWYHDELGSYNPTEMIGEYGADIDHDIRTNDTFDINTNYNASGKPKFWSQEYGALLHEYKVSKGESLKHTYPGQFMWVAFDFASPRLDRGSNPIPFMNQKGLIGHDHVTKKDVYYMYQSMYREASDYPMLYIVPSTWTTESDAPANVWVYSNCDSVMLYNDEQSFGVRTKDAGPRGDTRFEWKNINVNHKDIMAKGWYNGEVILNEKVEVK